jgi:lipopolysaccharide export system protein LptC
VPWTWQLRSALATYLPLLVMALLALGTWWLVKNTPGSDDQRVDRPVRHEADYTMSRFVVQRFDADGKLRVEMEGREARHYPDTDTIEIDDVQMRAIAPDGAVTIASARRALSNGKATDVQLMGGAQVVREAQAGEPPMEFRGEFLHALIDAQKLRSHLPVTIWRGDDELQAGSLDYDHQTRLLQFGGRVRATLQPPGATVRRAMPSTTARPAP